MWQVGALAPTQPSFARGGERGAREPRLGKIQSLPQRGLDDSRLRSRLPRLRGKIETTQAEAGDSRRAPVPRKRPIRRA